MKKTITVLLTISSIAFPILAMMCLTIIEPSLYCKKNNDRVYLNLIFCCFFSVLYATVIIGACANYAASPLFMELAVEMAFPVDETVVGGFMSCTYNLIGALFLFAFFIPNIGIWLIWKTNTILWFNYFFPILYRCNVDELLFSSSACCFITFCIHGERRIPSQQLRQRMRWRKVFTDKFHVRLWRRNLISRI